MIVKLARNFSKLHVKTISEISSLRPIAIKDRKEVETYLRENGLDGWTVNEANTMIERQLQFGSFVEAMSFMNSVGVFAERIQHHPDWYNVYNKVRINLNTHDAPGISLKDFYLAKYINMVGKKVLGAKPFELNEILTVSDDDYLR